MRLLTTTESSPKSSLALFAELPWGNVWSCLCMGAGELWNCGGGGGKVVILLFIYVFIETKDGSEEVAAVTNSQLSIKCLAQIKKARKTFQCVAIWSLHFWQSAWSRAILHSHQKSIFLCPKELYYTKQLLPFQFPSMFGNSQGGTCYISMDICVRKMKSPFSEHPSNLAQPKQTAPAVTVKSSASTKKM